MKKYLKYILLIPVAIIAVALTISYMKATPNPYPESKPDSEVPGYNEVALNHIHNYNGEEYLPVMGSAAIDVDGDGVSELFLGGGENQDDQLFKYSNGVFNKVSEVSFGKADKDATYGASVVDINNDGKDDLLLARESGGYIYLNNGSSFSVIEFDLHLNQKSRAISYAPADLNSDGLVDLIKNPGRFLMRQLT